jgi:hypothetical protein
MLNLEEDFRKINGTYSPETLKVKIAGIRRAHFHELPIHLNLEDLYDLASKNAWLYKDAPGTYRIAVPDAVLELRPSLV